MGGQGAQEKRNKALKVGKAYHLPDRSIWKSVKRKATSPPPQIAPAGPTYITNVNVTINQTFGGFLNGEIIQQALQSNLNPLAPTGHPDHFSAVIEQLKKQSEQGIAALEAQRDQNNFHKYGILPRARSLDDVYFVVSVVAIQSRPSEAFLPPRALCNGDIRLSDDIVQTHKLATDEPIYFKAEDLSDLDRVCMKALRFVDSPEIHRWSVDEGWEEVQEHILIKLSGPGWGWVEPSAKAFEQWYQETVEHGQSKNIEVMIGLNEDVAKRLDNPAGGMLSIEDRCYVSEDTIVLTHGGEEQYDVERD